MKNIMPLIVAVVLGALAVIGVSRYLKRMESDFNERVKPKEIVVAASDIKVGQTIVTEMLATRTFPEDMIPQQAVLPQDVNDIIGQPVARDIYKGEPILWTSVGTPKEQKRLSDSLKTGERAYTVAMSPESLVDCYVQPNDKVDILVTFDVPYTKKIAVTDEKGTRSVEEDATKKATIILLQNVTVLAAGKSFNKDSGVSSEDYGSITFSLAPRECLLLDFIKKHGELSLMLRNSEDYSMETDIEKIDMEAILDLTKLKAVNDDRKKRIEVYRQGQKMDVNK